MGIGMKESLNTNLTLALSKEDAKATFQARLFICRRQPF
jgi:hypothetical protein